MGQTRGSQDRDQEQKQNMHHCGYSLYLSFFLLSLSPPSMPFFLHLLKGLLKESKACAWKCLMGSVSEIAGRGGRHPLEDR